MQVVIDIPDRIYRTIQKRHLNIIDNEIVEVSIRNGTPLPKGHGRLGDLDELEKNMIGGINAGWLEEGYERYTPIHNMEDCVERVQWADTIIEADKEDE